MILSWAFNITPHGVVRDAGGSNAPSGGRRMEYVLIGLLVIAVGWIFYRESSLPDPTRVLPNSIAVLPCNNFSPNPENAHFAPGIHEEILNQLVKIGALNVIARTSVLQYEGAARPITEIAQELNVGSVMNCSVSYAEGRVSIAAQLIDAKTGLNIWAERYNEEFVGVFDIQADIARNIANALVAVISLAEQQNIERIPTNSPEAYGLYLRALANELGVPTMLPGVRENAIRYLNQAVELDPNFALAYAQLAWGYLHSFAHPVAPDAWLSRRAELEALVRRNAERALQLDPELGLAWAALGQFHLQNWRIAEADDAYDKALQLSPRNHMVVYWVALFHWFQNDDREETLQLARRAVELDPNNYLSWYLLGMHLHAGKAYEEAAVAFRKSVELAPAEPAEYIELARAEAALGNEARVLAALRTAELLMPAETSTGFLAYLAMGYGRLGYRNDAERLLTQVKSLASETYVGPGSLAMLYLGVGEYSQALDALNTAIENPSLLTHFHPFTIIVQNAYLDPILEQPEWMEVRSRLGFEE